MAAHLHDGGKANAAGSSGGGTGLGGGQPPSPVPFARDGLEGEEAALLASTTQKLREQGWAVVPSIIPPAEVAAVRESTLATLARRDATEAACRDPAGHGGHRSELARRVPGSWISVDQSLAPYLTHPQILGVAEDLWSTTFIKLTSTSPIVRFPSADGSPLPRSVRNH